MPLVTEDSVRVGLFGEPGMAIYDVRWRRNGGVERGQLGMGGMKEKLESIFDRLHAATGGLCLEKLHASVVDGGILSSLEGCLDKFAGILPLHAIFFGEQMERTGDGGVRSTGVRI